MERNQFLNVLDILKPAIATKDIIPVLQLVYFDGEYAAAYDGAIAIKTPCKVPFKGLLRGSTLAGALQRGSAKKLKFTQSDGELEIKAGRGVLRFPLTPLDHWPADVVNTYTAGIGTDVEPDIELDDTYLTGIERCLMSALDDESMAAQTGVTLSLNNGIVTLYSTNNVAITDFVVSDDYQGNLEEDIILPVPFCRALLGLCKALNSTGSLYVTDNSVTAKVDETILFAALYEGVVPLPFHEKIEDSTEDLPDVLIPIPSAFKEVVDQATFLLQESSTEHCTISVKSGVITVHTRSDYGEIHRQVGFEGDHIDVTVMVDPRLMAKVVDICDSFYILPKCTVFREGENYQYLISNKFVRSVG